MQRAHEHDPLAPIVNDHLGLSYSLAGQHEKALQQLHATIDVDPDFLLAHYRLGWVHLHMGSPEAAVPPLERAVQLSEGKTGAGMLGMAYGLTGHEREALLHRLPWVSETDFFFEKSDGPGIRDVAEQRM